MITLTKRLQAVADLVPAGCSFADIGTDHAYLPVWLLQKGVIDHAIAGDIRQGPLDHAKATAQRYHCMEQLSFRLSDGLSALDPHEADCVAIAGMGGEAMISILTAAPWTKADTRLILQPQTNLPELRRWLTGNGYAIREEWCLFEEGHWYTVMLVNGGEDPIKWTPGTAIAGHPSRWAHRPERVEYLHFLLERTAKELHGLEKAARPDEARIHTLTQADRELRAMIHSLTQEENV